MSRPAPDSASTAAAFDCRATAAMLKSMRSLEWASHIGAVLAIGGHKWFPLLVWGVVIYFAVRVRLDAELLEMLAEDPECAPNKLDQWLWQMGLPSSNRERSIEDSSERNKSKPTHTTDPAPARLPVPPGPQSSPVQRVRHIFARPRQLTSPEAHQVLKATVDLSQPVVLITRHSNDFHPTSRDPHNSP